MTVFVDSSAYLSVLIPTDSLHAKAIELSKEIFSIGEIITSYAILGEVLTIGNQRHNRQAAIDFVQAVFSSKTQVIMENKELVTRSFEIFKLIASKDVGWVDCYSVAIIEKYKIEKVFSFDKDFRKYSKAEVLK